MELKRVILGLAGLTVLGLAACGGDDDKRVEENTPVTVVATPAVPLKPLIIDLDSTSRLTIQAPEGATSRPGRNGPQVIAGEGFQLDLTLGTPSIEVTKKDVESNTVNVFKRYLAEDPVSLLWETEIGGKKEYHLYVAVSALRGFACEDSKGTVFTEEQARLMYQACRTIAPGAVPR